MRLTSDTNEARRILLQNRRLDIGDSGGLVSDSAQNVFGPCGLRSLVVNPVPQYD